MKNKEESSTNSLRGNTSTPHQRNHSVGRDAEAIRSLSRPGRTVAARAEQPALSLFPESLMEAVIDSTNMERAWKNVKANRGAPGPDGITIAKFPDWLQPRWSEIRQQLLDGTYRPGPVRRKIIDKPGGGQRLLGIPNVIERLIQQAIVQVLTPIFDPVFSESSFGFRPKRSAHGAAKQVQRTIRRGYRFTVDMDLSKRWGSDKLTHPRSDKVSHWFTAALGNSSFPSSLFRQNRDCSKELLGRENPKRRLTRSEHVVPIVATDIESCLTHGYSRPFGTKWNEVDIIPRAATRLVVLALFRPWLC